MKSNEFPPRDDKKIEDNLLKENATHEIAEKTSFQSEIAGGISEERAAWIEKVKSNYENNEGLKQKFLKDILHTEFAFGQMGDMSEDPMEKIAYGKMKEGFDILKDIYKIIYSKEYENQLDSKEAFDDFIHKIGN